MKQRIRLTEGQLNRMIKESVRQVLKESSYDINGNFDEEQHNSDLMSDFSDEIKNINNNINSALRSLSAIENMATNDRISKRARVVINALLNAGREMGEVSRLTLANRWDVD